jgi:ATP-dependent DNA helicase RecQ
MPTFGRLAAMTMDDLKTLLDVLVDAGLLERRGIEGGRPGAFVVALTEEGAAAMRGETRPMLAWPPAPSASPRAAKPSRPRSGASATVGHGQEEDEADPALLASLKSWRAAEARRRRVPAYIVFHDRTLLALAARHPTSAGELRTVPGLGPAKMESYADALLALLRRAPGQRSTSR